VSEQQELAPKGEKKPKAKEPSWGEGRILAALRERFAAPAFAFFPHVRNQTGYARTVRTADAVAMSLFPSRGLHITGVEIKSSRGDWRRELDDPSKAEEIAQHTDFWVLAVGDRDIVQPGELPPNWGLLAPAGKGLKMFVEPKLLGERDARISRTFLAAILRRAMEDSPTEAAINAAVQIAVDEARAQEREGAALRAKRDETNHQRDARDLRQMIADFEKASGISISRTWEAGRIGDAVRALQRNPHTDHLANQLDEGARALTRAAEEVRKASIPGVTVPAPTIAPPDNGTSA
jgi:hypothetical protein